METEQRLPVRQPSMPVNGMWVMGFARAVAAVKGPAHAWADLHCPGVACSPTLGSVYRRTVAANQRPVCIEPRSLAAVPTAMPSPVSTAAPT